MTPAINIAATVLHASVADLNGTKINLLNFGSGKSFKVALVTMPNVPSLPTISCVRL